MTHNSNYEDMIDMQHHTSKKHPQMSLENRAAQFAPFAALNGHEDAINETARLTDTKIQLDESELETLNMRLSEILGEKEEKKKVKITYFVADALKAGGAYLTVCEKIKSYDDFHMTLILEDKKIIPLKDIIDIQYCKNI